MRAREAAYLASQLPTYSLDVENRDAAESRSQNNEHMQPPALENQLDFATTGNRNRFSTLTFMDYKLAAENIAGDERTLIVVRGNCHVALVDSTSAHRLHAPLRQLLP